MKEIQRVPNLPSPTDCFGDEKPMATWYECPHCGKASPLTRQWISLTDEEIQALADPCKQPLVFRFSEYARAIEAKLKEKNHGSL